LETNLQEFVQEGTGEPLGEGGKNGNAGIARNSPEYPGNGFAIGRTDSAAGRAIKAGLRAENFERLD